MRPNDAVPLTNALPLPRHEPVQPHSNDPTCTDTSCDNERRSTDRLTVHTRIRKDRGKEGESGEEGRRKEKERREKVRKEVTKGR
jgi:hypothetical protein